MNSLVSVFIYLFVLLHAFNDYNYHLMTLIAILECIK